MACAKYTEDCVLIAAPGQLIWIITNATLCSHNALNVPCTNATYIEMTAL